MHVFHVLWVSPTSPSTCSKRPKPCALSFSLDGTLYDAISSIGWIPDWPRPAWRKTIDPNSWMTGRPKISKDHKLSSYTSSFISLTKKKHIPQAASSCLGRIQRPTHQKNQLGHPHPLTFVPSTIWPHLRGEICACVDGSASFIQKGCFLWRLFTKNMNCSPIFVDYGMEVLCSQHNSKSEVCCLKSALVHSLKTILNRANNHME